MLVCSFFLYGLKFFFFLMWKRISNSGFELMDNFGSHDYYYPLFILLFVCYWMCRVVLSCCRLLVVLLNVALMQPL